MDTAKQYFKIGKTIFDYSKKAGDMYATGLSKAIINALPAGDDTARPQYAGEKHVLLILKNGRPGVANYLGTGTQIIRRIVNNDPPRTPVDRASELHDVSYALSTFEKNKAKQIKDLRNADYVMLNQLDKIGQNKEDYKLNIKLGQLLIHSNYALEDVKNTKYTQDDKKLLEDERKRSEASFA